MARKTKKQSNTGKIILIVLLTILVAGAGLFLYGYTKYLNYLKPGSTNGSEVIFTIPDGLTGNEVISKLYEEQFIQNETATRIYVKVNKVPGFFAGDFRLRRNMTVAEIMDVITHEANAVLEEVDFTIIPGDWAKDAAEKIGKATGLKADDIMRKWNDIEYMKELMAKYSVLTDDILASEHCYLEGYITPETYRVFKDATIEEITEKILDETQSIFDEYKGALENSRFTIHQLYTLASIIQFEASDPEDMRWVSGVFYNRLNDGWTLGSSVTICYTLY
ncbi:MAG: endolytic transglycosylase MltG [Erysipelotrichaceae bacterium]|nr:endolytic transglycosylase MltG [Erysipelotrichaceae bacterium]